MSLDLQHTLVDLAGSVHDDALAARLTAQVGPMVGRIRRRRAARATAVGALSAATVAAMAVGVVALANRGGGGLLGPATKAPQPPAPVVHDGEPLECNDALPDALVSDTALAVAGETATNTDDGSGLLTTLRWWAPGPEEVTYAEASVDVAIARDGLVVGVASSEWPTEPPTEDVTLGSTETGTLGGFASALPVTACGGDTPLEAGSYRVVATVTLTARDGRTWRASAGPWPLTIGPAPVAGDVGAAVDAAAEEAEAAVQEIIAAAPGNTDVVPFGTCGTIVPPVTEDDPLILELDLDSGSGMLYAPGDPIDAVTILDSYRGRTVLANVPDAGATVVLVRDGVVVGRAAPADGGDVMLLETAPDAPNVLHGTGSVELCGLPGADAPDVLLPAGIYQAYAVLPVTLKEVTEADGTARSVSDTIVVRSEPVDVIVQEPRG